MIIERKYFV